MGIEIIFRDKKYFLTSERVQMIDLLLSTYEAALQRNLDFQIANEKLQKARDELEIRVQERTYELGERVKEIKCLYAVSDLVAQPRKTIDESLKVAVDLIPPGLAVSGDNSRPDRLSRAGSSRPRVSGKRRGSSPPTS